MISRPPTIGIKQSMGGCFLLTCFCGISSNMLLRNLILLIDVTFSTPTTNFDNRSFGMNDEVNLAVLDPAVAARLTENSEEAISNSPHITLKDWNRPS